MRLVIGNSKALHDFVVNEKKKTLAEEIMATIFTDIINKDCMITGSQTDHEQKKMWIEFTWDWRDEEYE